MNVCLEEKNKKNISGEKRTVGGCEIRLELCVMGNNENSFRGNFGKQFSVVLLYWGLSVVFLFRMF